MKEIHKILWTEYLWQGKKAKLNVRLASMPKEVGSIGVIDFETKVEASRVMTIKELVYSEGEWTRWVFQELERIKKRWRFSGCILRDLKYQKNKVSFDRFNFWEECFRVWAEAGGGRGQDGSVGMMDCQGKWIELQHLSSKIVYQKILKKKNEQQQKLLQKKWQGWDIVASNRIVKAEQTPPSVRQFFTTIRH